MQFSFSTDQQEFARALRELLDKEFTAAHLRKVWDSGEGHDEQLWSRLAEMGVLSMMVPESAGGMEATLVDTVLLLEELGRAAAPGPVIETMTLGAMALADTAWAPGIIDGSVAVTAALLGEPYIAHRGAHVLLLPGATENSIAVFDAAQVELLEVRGIDGGRSLSQVTRTGPMEPVAMTLGDGINIGAMATSAYLLGLSSRMLAIAGDYARDRRQFGQPIGAFQAVKHLMADALLKVEFARPAVYRAAWSLANESPTAQRDVSMAKALASDAAQKAARSALQVHGAIGYTWECDLQLFMKKAWALLPAWGSSSMHRRRVADAVLGPR